MGDYTFEDAELARLLVGDETADPKKLSAELRLIGYALSHPRKLPMLLREIADLKPTRELRLAIAAVLVDCELKMHMDLEKYQMRKFAAGIIEKALFGDEFLEGGVDLVKDGKKSRKKKGKDKGRKQDLDEDTEG